MKKIISLITAAALSVSCVAAASAARVEDISSALQNDEIHIIYNDKAVEYEDAKPVNTDGRVMIPFRAALETMNADVDYDEETKTVTATKGGTTITFELLDDTIYIDNNGEKSEITMDVPMLVEGDRTYVPVRFMSNALGMQVGWNGDNETVVIMDYDEYLQQIEEKIPNLKKLASYDTAKFNKCGITFDLNADAPDNRFNLSAAMNILMKDGKISADGTVKLDSTAFSLDESKFDIVLDGSILYIKTDVLKKMLGEQATMGVVTSVLSSGDKWFSLDLEKLGVDAMTLKVLQMAASGQVPDISEYMSAYINTEGDAQYGVVMQLAGIADMYELLDKKLVIEEKEDGYTVSLNLTPDDFSEFFGYKNNAPKLSVNVNSDATSEKVTANLEISTEVNYFTNVTNIVTIKMNEVAEMAGEDETITVPEDSMDLTSLLPSLLNQPLPTKP